MSKVKCFIKHSKTGAREMYEGTVSAISGIKEMFILVSICLVIFIPLLALCVGIISGAMRSMDAATFTICAVIALVSEIPWFKCVADPFLSCVFSSGSDKNG